MVDRYKRLAPLAAVVMVGLFVILFSLPNTPDSTASGARVIEWYRHHHTFTYVSATIVAFAGAAGVLYFLSVADFLRRRGSELLATCTVAGGVIFGAGMLLAAGSSFAANDGPQHFTADEARTLNVIQNNLFVPVVLGGIAIATLCMGVAMLRTKALPTALGVITTIVGVVAMSGIASWFGFMASGPLALVVAGYVYLELGRPTQITLPEIPAARVAADGHAKARAKT